MSASLFDNWGSDYESYPSTVYIKGDYTFGECQYGDIIYSINSKNEIKELIVFNPLHNSKGHIFITYKDGNKKKTINFGPSNVGNCIMGKDKSIVIFDDYIFGTNKESIIKYKIEKVNSDIVEVIKEREFLTKRLNNKKDELINLSIILKNIYYDKH